MEISETILAQIEAGDSVIYPRGLAEPGSRLIAHFGVGDAPDAMYLRYRRSATRTEVTLIVRPTRGAAPLVFDLTKVMETADACGWWDLLPTEEA